MALLAVEQGDPAGDGVEHGLQMAVGDHELEQLVGQLLLAALEVGDVAGEGEHALDRALFGAEREIDALDIALAAG